jgi:hypothetical protein
MDSEKDNSDLDDSGEDDMDSPPPSPKSQTSASLDLLGAGQPYKSRSYA